MKTKDRAVRNIPPVWDDHWCPGQQVDFRALAEKDEQVAAVLPFIEALSNDPQGDEHSVNPSNAKSVTSEIAVGRAKAFGLLACFNRRIPALLAKKLEGARNGQKKSAANRKARKKATIDAKIAKLEAEIAALRKEAQ